MLIIFKVLMMKMFGMFGYHNVIAVQFESGDIKRIHKLFNIKDIYQEYKNGNQLYIVEVNDMSDLIYRVNNITEHCSIGSVQKCIDNTIQYGSRFGEDLNLLDKVTVINSIKYAKRNAFRLYRSYVDNEVCAMNLAQYVDNSLLQCVLIHNRKIVDDYIMSRIEKIKNFDFYGDERYISIDVLDHMSKSMNTMLGFTLAGDQEC